jgi:hypothetical protein
MISNDEKELQILTKKPLSEQNRLLKLFAKLNLFQKKEIISKQRSIFHILNSNNKNYDNATLTLASLIISIEKFFISQNETELNLIRFNNKKVNKNQKNKKLLTFWSVVKELKEKKHMSFREISEFLKKSHKFEISHSLIYKVWIEVEKKETI